MFNYLSHSYRIIAHQDKYNSHKVETIKINMLDLFSLITVYQFIKKYFNNILLLFVTSKKNFEKKKMQQN